MGGDGQILREFAQRTDVSTELRAEALFWIGETDGGAQYLRSIFGSLNDTELRSNALHAIAQEEDPANRDWLVALAKNASEDMEVRTEALFWAAEAGAFEASELRGLFSSFTDAEMKVQVIFAASQRDDRESVDFLMEVAENPENGEVREQAIFWLGQSEDSRVPEFLLRIIGR
jgi:HEAT repeat protein